MLCRKFFSSLSFLKVLEKHFSFDSRQEKNPLKNVAIPMLLYFPGLVISYAIDHDIQRDMYLFYIDIFYLSFF